MHRSSITTSKKHAYLAVFAFVSICTFVFFRYSPALLQQPQIRPHYDVQDFKVVPPHETAIEHPEASLVATYSIDESASATPTINSGVAVGTAILPETLQSPDVVQSPSKGKSDATSKIAWDELQERIDDYLQWNRPSSDHWPPWHDYDYADYDPNRWEGMEREDGYYVENTVTQLEKRGVQSEVYLPYPTYNSKQWKEQWKGRYMPCPGPGGKIYADSLEYLVRGYPSSSEKFPKASIGSANVLGLDEHVCFDRNSRYTPYGLESIEEDRHSTSSRHVKRNRDWDYTGWGRLQDVCFEMNQNRYQPKARVSMVLQPTKFVRREASQVTFTERANGQSSYHSRTAVLLRTWEGYKYEENDLQAIRSLITELSLLSGGEYQVYLLVNVKQREADIYNDPMVYQDILKRAVPAEFRDIAVLWTERVLEEWYPKVGDWQVYWMQFMPLQWFSKTHPEFDYIWNWETDARYIGNHYHFLEQIAAFARNMPRKHLWERNSRFYVPEHHGSWESFLNDTDAAILQAKQQGILRPIWGPEPYAPFQYPLGPDPPTRQEDDNFSWGVGEDADLITLQPMWDPSETEWSYRNHIWNYIPTVRPEFTSENRNGDGIYHPGFATIPRRVFINTQARLSKRLLNAMHKENLEGRSMQAEMWPATVALQHGLKAVYAPHPVWTDRKWPGWYMDAVFNAYNNQTARWGQQEDSPYSHDREANFGGLSWYYRSVFPHKLYRRWLGWAAHDWGWDADQAKEKEWNRVVELGLEDEQKDSRKRKFMIDIAGRMCLPGMLLHPVKDVREDADGG